MKSATDSWGVGVGDIMFLATGVDQIFNLFWVLFEVQACLFVVLFALTRKWIG